MTANGMMQDSGVEWIGPIPQEWRIDSLKRLLDEPLKYGANEAAELDDRALPRYIRITDFNHDGLLKDGSFKSLPLDKAAGYYLKTGDVLFARSGATVGKTFIFYGEDKKACFAGYLIKASTTRHLLSPEFLYFYTKSPAYDIWKNSIFTQATIQNIGADKYAYLPIIVPPITEQKRITQYLDQRCGKLDAIIAIKQQQIKTLDALRQSIIYHAVTKGLDESVPLVDSGVEWLGKIPKGWKLLRLKSIADIRYGLGQPPATKDDGVPMVRATDISRGEITAEKMLTIDPDTLPLGRNPYLKEDEIIVVRSGAYTGDSAIIPAQYAGAVAGYDMVVTVNGANPKFIAYCLLNGYVLERQLRLLMLRAAQPHLNSQELGGILLILPKSTEEQKSIVAYLDQETQRLNDLKANLSQQISTLEAYKKALIYECVTGKKRIKTDELKTG